jgi:hypothetical protein
VAQPDGNGILALQPVPSAPGSLVLHWRGISVAIRSPESFCSMCCGSDNRSIFPSADSIFSFYYKKFLLPSFDLHNEM